MESVYQSHFGLVRDPFNITPDPSFLYPSASHREALAQLVYGIKARKGFVVLTGEVGTGKTTLIHALLRELDGAVKTALIFNIIESPKDLMRYLCGELGLTTPQEGKREVRDYLSILNEFLLSTYRGGGNVSLIIDEAQNLSTEVLESIRLLSNFETSRDKLIQILMVGQPELSQRLNTPELRQLKQRVVLRYQLKPLTSAECSEYISNRIETAGGSPLVFRPKAVESIYLYSSGTPRLINILCDNGMLSAYAAGRKDVDDVVIEEIAKDLCLTDLRGAENGHPRGAQVNENQADATAVPTVGRPRRWVRAACFMIALASLVAGITYFTVFSTGLHRFDLDFFGEIIDKVRSVLMV